MAAYALPDDDPLVVFPGFDCVNVGMAPDTCDPLLCVDTGGVLSALLFVTSGAIHLLELYAPGYVPQKIVPLQMTTRATVFAMYGPAKRGGRYFFAMAPKAVHGIDGNAADPVCEDLAHGEKNNKNNNQPE